MDLDDARRSALALPEVTERQSWGQPAWFHRNLVARMWDEDRLTVRVEDDGERLALVEQEPALYSTTDHHAGTNLVLIAMGVVDERDAAGAPRGVVVVGGAPGAPAPVPAPRASPAGAGLRQRLSRPSVLGRGCHHGLGSTRTASRPSGGRGSR